MKKLAVLFGMIAAVGLGVLAAGSMGWIDHPSLEPFTTQAKAVSSDDATASEQPEKQPKVKPGRAEAPGTTAPAVTVAYVREKDFVATIPLTGSLVAREDILLAAEIDGVRIVSIQAEEGDRVSKGQELARFQDAKLQTELAENTAALKRLEAEQRQIENQRIEAVAVLDEAKKSYDRAKPLKSSGYLSESVLDQRLTAFRTAKARAASATDGLKLVSARIGEVRARRRNIEWRLSKTKLVAPVDGTVFERRARIGQQVSTATEALFRIAEDSDIELEADVEDFRMSQLKVGQSADVISAGDTRLKGKIRLISSSIDKSTRLGRIRIAIDNDVGLKIGAFAQATVDIARSRGLAVPASAILYGRDGPRVQRVIDNKVVTTPVKVGLTTNGATEIVKGLSKADRVVAKSGTFLRNGDPVRPIERVPVVSEARP